MTPSVVSELPGHTYQAYHDLQTQMEPLSYVRPFLIITC